MTHQEQGINRLKNTQKESFPLELETLLEKYKISQELDISSYQLMQSINRFIDNLKIFSRDKDNNFGEYVANEKYEISKCNLYEMDVDNLYKRISYPGLENATDEELLKLNYLRLGINPCGSEPIETKEFIEYETYLKNKYKKKKVFLGGTCNNSTWRDELIPLLKTDYFNPVVDDWTNDTQMEEIKQREVCDFILYTITSEIVGVYSIAEVIEDTIKRPDKTLFCVIENGFTESQLRSLQATAKMVKLNKGKCFNSLKEVANYLNNQ